MISNLNFSQKNEVFYKIKINYSSLEELINLANNGVNIDHGFHKKNHFYISDFSETELDKIKSLNFNYEIIISFFFKSNEFCNLENNEYQTPENYDFKNGNEFGGFYTYDEMLSELDDMHNQFPNLIFFLR